MKWISWYQPTEDHRPLTYPPNAQVLGWWHTGSGEAGKTLVAIVEASTEEEAQAVVLKDWPEAERWRFCTDIESKEMSDRFPLDDWMAERGLTSK